jgi:hypothetical protein
MECPIRDSALVFPPATRQSKGLVMRGHLDGKLRDLLLPKVENTWSEAVNQRVQYALVAFSLLYLWMFPVTARLPSATSNWRW